MTEPGAPHVMHKGRQPIEVIPEQHSSNSDVRYVIPTERYLMRTPGSAPTPFPTRAVAECPTPIP